MVYEQRCYTVAIDKRQEFVSMIRDVLLPLFDKYGGKVVGVWETDIGRRDEVMYMMAFEDLGARERFWAAFRKDEAYAKLGPRRLVTGLTVSILRPAEFSPLK